MQGEELGFRANYNHFQRVNSFLSLNLKKKFSEI